MADGSAFNKPPKSKGKARDLDSILQEGAKQRRKKGKERVIVKAPIGPKPRPHAKEVVEKMSKEERVRHHAEVSARLNAWKKQKQAQNARTLLTQPGILDPRYQANMQVMTRNAEIRRSKKKREESTKRKANRKSRLRQRKGWLRLGKAVMDESHGRVLPTLKGLFTSVGLLATGGNLAAVGKEYIQTRSEADAAREINLPLPGVIRPQFVQENYMIPKKELPPAVSYLGKLYFGDSYNTETEFALYSPTDMLSRVWDAKPKGEAANEGKEYYIPNFEKVVKAGLVESMTLDEYLKRNEVAPGVSFTEAVSLNLDWTGLQREYHLSDAERKLASKAIQNIDPLVLDAIMMSEVMSGNGEENVQTLNFFLMYGGKELLAALPSLGKEPGSLRSVGPFQITNYVTEEGTGPQTIASKYTIGELWDYLRLPQGYGIPLREGEAPKEGVSTTPYGTSYDEQKLITMLLAVANIIDIVQRSNENKALAHMVNEFEAAKTDFEQNKKDPIAFERYQQAFKAYAAVIGLMHHYQGAGAGALVQHDRSWLRDDGPLLISQCASTVGDAEDRERYRNYAKRMEDNASALLKYYNFPSTRISMIEPWREKAG